MKNTNPNKVNLFKSRKVSFLDKFMKWALGIGRFLVIVTESIALLAFLYRFSLDRNLIDLHDSIKSKQAIVKLLKNNEDTFRNLQERIDLAKSLSQKNQGIENIFSDVLNLGKGNITFTNVIVSESQIKIDAQTQSIAAVKTFIDSLKSYSKFSDVSIDSIQNRSTTGTILLSISATLKKNQNTNVSTQN